MLAQLNYALGRVYLFLNKYWNEILKYAYTHQQNDYDHKKNEENYSSYDQNNNPIRQFRRFCWSKRIVAQCWSTSSTYNMSRFASSDRAGAPREKQ